jgi:broad-specificity NMP kinase
MAYVEPIIFVLGTSGVGKSYVSKALKEDYAFLHLDIDRNHGFERNGFPTEWDKDFSKVDCAQLATQVRTSVAAQQRNGAILSFPTVHLFSTIQLEDASRVGISTIVLWGSEPRIYADNQGMRARCGND